MSYWEIFTWITVIILGFGSVAVFVLFLKDINEIILPKIHPNVKHVFHLYVVRVKRRSELQVFLKDLEVSTGIHYPKPLPFLKAYKYLDYKTCDIPVASDYMNQILSLPMYPELNTRQIKSICSSISRFFTM